MGRMYTLEFENQSVTNANGDYELMEIVPADDKPIAIHAIFISQTTEIGDAQEEQLRIRIITGHATAGSGGPGALTPRPLNSNDAAAGATARYLDPTLASTGTPINIHSDAFNVRTGWVYLPTPEMRPVVSEAGDTRVNIRLMAAVTDDLNMSMTVYFEELA